ncbi:MAG TPA: hypothetical protein VEI97_06860 [bacterium]|nr:hypothetical protein [bacterium]
MDPGTIAILGALQLGGGLLSGMGQQKMSREQIAAQERMQQRQLEAQRAFQGLNATQMDPLAQQRSRQQMALMAAILPELRNVQVSSNIPGMNQFIPQISGGLRIPEGGFSPETLAFSSPQARAAAEQNFRAQSDLVNTPMDGTRTPLSALGYPKGALPAGPAPLPDRPARDRRLRAQQSREVR